MPRAFLFDRFIDAIVEDPSYPTIEPFLRLLPDASLLHISLEMPSVSAKTLIESPCLWQPPPAEGSSISLSEIVSALSLALDLTEGAVPGHAFSRGGNRLSHG